MRDDKRLIKEAIDETFAYLDERPSLEARIMNSIDAQERPRRRVRTSLILAFAILLALSMVAYAEYRWHVLGAFPWFVGENPVNADEIMQSDLASVTADGVTITIEEAGYDGRTLFVTYSHRAEGDDTVYTEENAYEFWDNHPTVGWWSDTLWINGEAIGMAWGSATESIYTGVPGELMTVEYWRLEHEDVLMDGVVEISLPIGRRQEIPPYRMDPTRYDEYMNMLLPEDGAVTFTLDTRGVQERVKTIEPNIVTDIGEATAWVSEAVFTPMKTYITLHHEVKPEAMAAYIAENGEGYYDDQGNLMFPFTGADVLQDWAWRLTLVDGEGNALFPGKSGAEGFGDTMSEFTYPYIEEMPYELYLAPVNDGIADMSRAVKIK